MQIFKEFNQNSGLSLTFGMFDGMHTGHIAVIKSTVNFAKANKLKSALITFSKHPCSLLYGIDVKWINDRKKKLLLFSELGIDFVYEIDFTSELATLSAEEYLKNVIVKNFSPKSISTGYNHNFGYKKSGSTKLLTEMQYKYNYKYFEVKPQSIEKEVASSSLIREKLSKGLIESANKFMEQRFSINGMVMHGNKLGRKIGFRTANIEYPRELIKIPYGVYQAETKICDTQKMYKSIVNFGKRPSIEVETVNAIVESHIMDGFCYDIYNKELEIHFIKKIRDERHFNSIDELKQQISNDCLTY